MGDVESGGEFKGDIVCGTSEGNGSGEVWGDTTPMSRPSTSLRR